MPSRAASGARRTGMTRGFLAPALTALVSLSLIVSLLSIPATVHSADDIQGALQKATEYFMAHQNPDGGYGPYAGDGEARVPNVSDVGITALVVYALARHPARYKPEDGPWLSRAVDYLLSKQQPDGAFYDPRDPALKNYRTSVVILALSALDPARYSEAIEKARRYVTGLQHDESSRYAPDEHISFGGIAYGGSSVRPDLSNSGLAAEALWESGTSASHPLWRRLEVFVSRCQNMPDVPPLLERAGIGTTGDGGFRYAPNDTRGPVESLDGKRVFSSYGSMTYQGLKSLLYAGVKRDDPRVAKAFEWISRNFTVKENPGMATDLDPQAGKQGYFYYVHTMAKCLSVYGEPRLRDARGVEHDWARELSGHLLAIQKEDGSWVNESDRWWENLETLDTAFAMVTLSICRDEMAKQARAAEEAEPAEESADGAPEGESARARG